MTKYKCPQCGEPALSGRFSMYVMYECDVTFDSDGTPCNDGIIDSAELPNLATEFLCRFCGHEFNEFDMEER